MVLRMFTLCHVCMWCVCVYGGTLTCLCWARDWCQDLPFCYCLPYFKIKSLSPGFTILTSLAESPRSACVCLHHWSSRCEPPHLGFYLGSEALNSDPPACTVSTLSAEPSPQPWNTAIRELCVYLIIALSPNLSISIYFLWTLCLTTSGNSCKKNN